jgi:choline-sulfatase
MMERRDFLKSLTAGAAIASLKPALSGASDPSAAPEASANPKATVNTGPKARPNASPRANLTAGSKASPKPHILFLMADQFRWDCMGCAGNRVIRTPNLDAIAREGVVFQNAYSSTPTCTPARAALLTGQAPWHHAMLGYGAVAEHYPVEMPRCLREAGYYTFGVGKMHWFPQKTLHGFHGTLVDESGRVESPGFISDYRRWFRDEAPGQDPDATGIGWNDYQAGVYALDEKLHPTVWTGQTALEQIRRCDPAVPLFLKVSFARPHSPYDPPARFMNLYKEEDMPAAVVGDWAAKYAPHADPPPSDAWHGDLGEAQALKSRRGYYGSVSFIDEQIGKILQTLKDRGMYDNTLILFTSDHGDMLGDHNLWRKSYAYESSAHVPMLLRWPRNMGMEGKRGTALPQPVELRDLLPTFLDAAGAPIPKSVDGASLLELVRGNTAKWRPWIDLEHAVCYSKENHWNALTDGRFKYIYFALDGSEQLFDLGKDRGETRDLSNDPACSAILKKWRERLTRRLAERGPDYVRDGKLVKGRKNMLYGPLFPIDEATSVR